MMLVELKEHGTLGCRHSKSESRFVPRRTDIKRSAVRTGYLLAAGFCPNPTAPCRSLGRDALPIVTAYWERRPKLSGVSAHFCLAARSGGNGVPIFRA